MYQKNTFVHFTTTQTKNLMIVLALYPTFEGFYTKSKARIFEDWINRNTFHVMKSFNSRVKRFVKGFLKLKVGIAIL